MFTMAITPRFYETDALGHINNTVLPCWFETARGPVFRLFNPALQLKEWNLILARVEVDFLAQIHFGHEVTIVTGIEKIGSASFVVIQEAWQKNLCVAQGKAVQVFFNYLTQKSEPLPASLRTKLDEHLMLAS
jgi:acyl-CoA thioester hydrolase